MKCVSRLFAMAFLCGSIGSLAQTPRLTIDTSVGVSKVSPTLYGLMTEEINFSYDGGLYGEMVRNRTFDAQWPRFEHWVTVTQGNAQEKVNADDTGPSEALHKSLKLDIAQSSPGNEAGLANAGYWGMAVRPSTIYRGSFYAKAERVGAAHVRLVSDETGATLAEIAVDVKDGDWQRYSYNLKTAANVKPSLKNHLEITFA